MSDSPPGKQSKKSRLMKRGLSMFSRRSRSPSRRAGTSTSASVASVPPQVPQDDGPTQLNSLMDLVDLKMKATPLPELPPSYATVSGAYSQILMLEKKEQAAYTGSRKASDDRSKRLIYARILGYLILVEGPSDQARATVELEVNACDGNGETILHVGKFYFDHYIRAFKKYKGRTPAPCAHPSSRSFDTRKAMIMEMLVKAPQDHKRAKANALVRDGFRCVITGRYDLFSIRKNKLQEDWGKSGVTFTECAHIFPESTNANFKSKLNIPRAGSDAQPQAEDIKLHYASRVWTIMERFGFPEALEELNGSKVHRLENILTLSQGIHALFDNLLLWLEPDGNIPDTYKICLANSASAAYNGPGDESPTRNRTPRVTFSTPDPVNLPVPSPSYLKLHAACCRIFCLSGDLSQ